MTTQLNQPGVTVWGGISCDGVAGPVSFDEPVNGPRYLDMLTEVVVPQLQERPGYAELFFQQDGAPPHYSLVVRQYLDQAFPHHWIGSIEWPPRSPDLTPMNFFFWGVLKDKVYARKPVKVQQLKNFIEDVFQETRSHRNLCRTVCVSVGDRLHECTPRSDYVELFFQQDGAPPHYSLAVHQYLDQAFPHHWTGRWGSIKWPPRSPDLTPMDFFFWGVLKDKVYARKPVTVQQLKNFIEDAFLEIRSHRNLCHTVCVLGTGWTDASMPKVDILRLNT